MRGTFFGQPFEFKLEVDGEQWHQGDSISCALYVKNRGTSVETLDGVYLHLACGTTKKVQQKADDAFQIVLSAELGASGVLDPGEQRKFVAVFELDKNCIISEKAQSLYLVCGRGEIASPAGHLALPILPHEHIEALISSLECSFSFVLKGQKSKKGWVEAKLKPPEGKEFPTVEHLMLFSCLQDETLCLKYVFNVKTIDGDGASIGVKKAKREIKQEIPFAQYLFPGGLINIEPLEKTIDEALSVIRSKF